MTERKSGRGARVLLGLAAVAVSIGVLAFWLTRAGDPMRPDETTEAPVPVAPVEGGEVDAFSVTPGARAPAQIIEDRGRLRVTREALREGDILAIGVAMPDEARGEGPRRVKVADIDGRAMETRGFAIDGDGTGLRIEIDPEWLLPGRYLIQVETAEERPLGLRRYVLEVVGDDAE